METLGLQFPSLSTALYADACVKGGAELLANTQNAYFEKCLENLPYLRLFRTIMAEDLVDIARNADLQF